MAAGDKIFQARYLEIGASQIAGVVAAKINTAFTGREDPGAAGSPGPAGRIVGHRRITVEAYAIHESIMVAMGVSFNGTAVAGATYARITPSTVERIDQGVAAWPGDAGAILTRKMLAVEIYGNQYAALMAMIGETAANVAVAVLDNDSAAQTVTVTNVYFSEAISPVDIPEKDAGGKLAPYGIRGWVNWGGADTFATVLTSTSAGAFGLLAILGTAQANAVIGTVGAGGAAEKITVKNVTWTMVTSNIEIPANDAGGKLALFGVRGYAAWASTDTLATMIVAAAD
jgi:hypothetical protein